MVKNRSMKTTVDIPDNELKDAMRFTKARTKREAVVTILEEFNRRRRMAELVKYSGTFADTFPTNEEIEAVDAKRDLGLCGAKSAPALRNIASRLRDLAGGMGARYSAGGSRPGGRCDRPTG